MKRAGGRRFYRPQDVVVLKGVKTLLYGQGYKIEGVQKLHREQGLKRVVAAADPEAAEALNGHAMDEPIEFEHEGAHETAASAMAGDKLARLRRALHELEAAKAKLDALLD
jgi:DNA-binding transcriptional MerR regulator